MARMQWPMRAKLACRCQSMWIARGAPKTRLAVLTEERAAWCSSRSWPMECCPWIALELSPPSMLSCFTGPSLCFSGGEAFLAGVPWSKSGLGMIQADRVYNESRDASRARGRQAGGWWVDVLQRSAVYSFHLSPFAPITCSPSCEDCGTFTSLSEFEVTLSLWISTEVCIEMGIIGVINLINSPIIHTFRQNANWTLFNRKFQTSMANLAVFTLALDKMFCWLNIDSSPLSSNGRTFTSRRSLNIPLSFREMSVAPRAQCAQHTHPEQF